MREKKFRAWTGKKMSASFGLSNFCADGIIHAEDGDVDSDALEAPIMQYTGTKDKTGKEIYEGDIITHNNDGMTGVVTWSEGLYRFVIENLQQTEIIADLCDYDFEPEVLGNIYENPELLEASND